jgi:hypothetical protein
MKKITSCILAGALFCSASAHAEGTQIGTAPLLVASGFTNIFSQVQAGDRVGITARYNRVNGTYLDTTVDLSAVSLAYKSYFNSYAEGLYLELGVASFDVSVSTNSQFSVGSAIMPIAVGGYEWSFDNGFVLGLEGGLGTSGGMGIFGFNTAFQF